MKKVFFILTLFFIYGKSTAQNVGINNADPKTALDINGALRLRPVTAVVSGTGIILNSNVGYHFLNGSPVGNFGITFSPTVLEGHHTIITNTTAFVGNVFLITIPAQTTVELFFSNGEWKQIGSSQLMANTAWNLNGNVGINPALQFMGTTSNADVIFKRNNMQSGLLEVTLGSTSWGVGALNKNNYGTNNTATGISAMAQNQDGSENVANGAFALANNTVGWGNTAVGKSTLSANVGGDNNTAIGLEALATNTIGAANTATGVFSLYSNQTGNSNTALGYAAMVSNTSGILNTAIGARSLNNNTTGFSNVAVGVHALYSNITRSNLVAIGDSALYRNGFNATINTHAISNTAVGSKSQYSNSTGSYNTSLGFNSLYSNSLGMWNIAIGYGAMGQTTNSGNNVAIGNYALSKTVRKYSVAIGDSALAYHSGFFFDDGTASNVAIGYKALKGQVVGFENTGIGTSAGENNQSGIGNVYVGYKSGYNSLSGGINVYLGYKSGFNAFGGSKLYIENSEADSLSALIYGDFSADSLLLNAKTINRNSFNIRGANVLEMGYGVAGKQTDAGKISYGGFGDANFLGIVGAGTDVNGNDRVIKLWSEGGLRVRGNALPDANNLYTLGNSTTRWKEVWTNAGAINTSDANLKTNITTSPYGLEEVMRMHPVQYNWKSNPGEDLQIGFLAQDIQKIIPEAVVVPANGDPLGMKYTELIPVLVKAIQELKNEILELKKQLKK